MVQLEKYLTVGEVLAHLAPGSLVVAIAALVLGVNPATLTSALGVSLFLLISYLVGVLLDVLHHVVVDHTRFRRMRNRRELHKSLHARAQDLIQGLEETTGDDLALLVTALLAHLRRRNEEVASYVSRQLDFGNLVVNAGVSLALVGLIGLVGMPHLRRNACRSTDAVAAIWSDRAQSEKIGILLFDYREAYPRGDPCRRAAWIAARRASLLPGLGPDQDRKAPDWQFVRFTPAFASGLPARRPWTGPPYYDLSRPQLVSMDGDGLVRNLQQEFARISRCPYCRSAGVLEVRDGGPGPATGGAAWRRPQESWLWRRFLMPPSGETYYVFLGSLPAPRSGTSKPSQGGDSRGDVPQQDPHCSRRYIVTVPLAVSVDQCTAQEVASPSAVRHLRLPKAEALTRTAFTRAEEDLLREAQDKLAAGEYMGYGLLLSLGLGVACYIVGRRRVGWHLSYLAYEAFRYPKEPPPPPSPSPGPPQ